MERRGIGHRVPILGGRRLAEVVPLVGGACPSGYLRFGGEIVDKVRILDRLISIFSVFMIYKQLVHVYRE